jgi:hypothetical protein
MAATGHFSCPPAGTFVAVSGQFLVAAISRDEPAGSDRHPSCLVRLLGLHQREQLLRRTGGPVDQSTRYRSYRELGPVGNTFSEGFQLLETSAPVTVDSIDVSGGDKALRYLGARIGLPGRPDDFNQFMLGYPPKAVPAQFQRPAPGTHLQPGSRYMLIIGYRVTHDVLDMRTRITVRYTTDDGSHFALEFPAQVVTCPSSLPEIECSQEADRRFGRFD